MEEGVGNDKDIHVTIFQFAHVSSLRFVNICHMFFLFISTALAISLIILCNINQILLNAEQFHSLFLPFMYYRSDKEDNESEHSGDMDAELDSDQEQDLDKILGSWLGELENMTQVYKCMREMIFSESPHMFCNPYPIL